MHVHENRFRKLKQKTLGSVSARYTTNSCPSSATKSYNKMYFL